MNKDRDDYWHGNEHSIMNTQFERLATLRTTLQEKPPSPSDALHAGALLHSVLELLGEFLEVTPCNK